MLPFHEMQAWWHAVGCMRDFRSAGAVFVTLVSVMALAVSGCSNNNTSGSAFEGTGSPIYDGPDPIPYGGGRYKVGNAYQIAGRTYHPREDTSYDETGTASWYGDRFHRRQTANGEWFDMNRLTAAHPTLPLPIYARVTNLGNNKSIVVRINDRGPYAHDRLIDLSRASAEALDFIRAGTARVRVQYLGRAPLDDDGSDLIAMNNGRATTTVAQATQSSDLVSGQSHTASAAEQNDRGPAEPAASTGNFSGNSGSTATSGRYFIQAASFSNRNNALMLHDRLQTIGNVQIDESTVGTRTYYRVRVGPLADTASADNALREVISAGHRDARIVAN
jgi:rare lipoprotein A